MIKKLLIIVAILLYSSSAFGISSFEAKKRVLARKNVAAPGGGGSLGQSTENFFSNQTDDALLFYTQFTATPGDATEAHALVSSIGGNGTDFMIYLFSSAGVYVNSWASGDLYSSVTWINITMGVPETLGEADYLLGWVVENDSSFNVKHLTSGGNGLYSIAYTFGATTDITPGSATEIDADAMITTILNNASGDPL